MIFRHDAGGTYLEFVPSEGVEPLVPPEEFLGKTVEDVMPPEFAEAAMAHIGQVLQDGGMATHEYSLPVGDEPHHFEYRMVRCAADEVLGIVRDITERKGVEAERKRAYDDLEARVESRTRDLHEANVALRAQIEERQQANEEARALREELAHVTRVATMGELAASLAHELNQPLAAMVSNAQAASRFLSNDAPELDEVQEALEEIAEDGKRAGKVIRGLRELLKRGDQERKVLEVNQFVEDVLDLVRSDAVMQNITLTTRLASDLPKVSGDQVQLQQVVLNLLRNGSEAMSGLKNSKRELVIATAPGNAGDVEVSVQDSGAGISPDDMWRVFDAFYTTKPDGLGMGLSINRSIVEAHKGRIWATPNQDQGTTFRFTLPTVGQ
jgi:C4-dicarboxylate-specific signal transduction histidine kinase